MNAGFDTLKDILDVVIVPVVIFGLGAMLPHMIEVAKRRRFLSLIRRELNEMEPRPPEKKKDGKWHQHLDKRFIHQEIFKNPSESRDFILSLPPDVAYSGTQLWFHYEKATASNEPGDLAKHGASWCDQLWALCKYFDGKAPGCFRNKVYEPWETLILQYHPDQEKRIKQRYTTAKATADGCDRALWRRTLHRLSGKSS